MRNELGSFEGQAVEAAAFKLTGVTTTRVGHLERNETVYFVGKASVAKITHGDLKTVFTRLHKATATEVVLIERADGQRMLDEAQAMADDRFGLANLFADAHIIVGHDPETGEIDEDGADG